MQHPSQLTLEPLIDPHVSPTEGHSRWSAQKGGGGVHEPEQLEPGGAPLHGLEQHGITQYWCAAHIVFPQGKGEVAGEPSLSGEASATAASEASAPPPSAEGARAPPQAKTSVTIAPMTNASNCMVASRRRFAICEPRAKLPIGARLQATPAACCASVRQLRSSDREFEQEGRKVRR
jgi:hypothetical protein